MNLQLKIATALSLSMIFSQAQAAENLRFGITTIGESEYEAVSSAYSTALADALSVSVGPQLGTVEGSLRQKLERELAEDFRRVTATYLTGSFSDCDWRWENIECQSVVLVQMDELNAWVRDNLDNVGAGANRLGDISFSLIGNVDANSPESDFMAWLHSALELEFGQDVLFETRYIDPQIVTNDCSDYRRLIDEYSSRGDEFRQAVSAYEADLAICERLRQTDIVMALNNIELSFGEFNGRDRSLNGQIRVGLDFIQPAENRRLPSPTPRSIIQYGYGESYSVALPQLRDSLYEASINYISQQFINIVSTVQDEGRLVADVDSFTYEVLASGIDTDTQKGRETLRSTRNWFRSNYGLELEVDYTNPQFGEVTHTFSTQEPVNWTRVSDGLYDFFDSNEIPVRIDVDTDSNLTLSFIDDGPQADRDIIAQVTDNSISRNIELESANMVVRRRNPDTGIAITVNEAHVTIRNTSRRDLRITIDPIWTNAGGSVEDFSFSNMKYKLIPRRSSASFSFRAPNRFSQGLSLEIACPAAGCRVD